MRCSGTSAALTCREFVEVVTDYLEGVLSDTDRARFDDHIADCDMCPRYLTQMRQTIRAVGRLTENDLSPEVRTHMLERFRDWHKR